MPKWLSTALGYPCNSTVCGLASRISQVAVIRACIVLEILHSVYCWRRFDPGSVGYGLSKCLGSMDDTCSGAVGGMAGPVSRITVPSCGIILILVSRLADIVRWLQATL